MNPQCFNLRVSWLFPDRSSEAHPAVSNPSISLFPAQPGIHLESECIFFSCHHWPQDLQATPVNICHPVCTYPVRRKPHRGRLCSRTTIYIQQMPGWPLDEMVETRGSCASPACVSLPIGSLGPTQPHDDAGFIKLPCQTGISPEGAPGTVDGP